MSALSLVVLSLLMAVPPASCQGSRAWASPGAVGRRGPGWVLGAQGWKGWSSGPSHHPWHLQVGGGKSTGLAWGTSRGRHRLLEK